MRDAPFDYGPDSRGGYAKTGSANNVVNAA
jgi:hypothetical protein